MRRRCAAWIACLAILLTSLAPSISHALVAAQGAPNAWMEICTMDGSKLMMVEADQSKQQPTEKVSHLEHCAFCMTHAESLALPPPADFVMPMVSGKHLLPSLFYQASRPLFAWAAAQPRAPPAFS